MVAAKNSAAEWPFGRKFALWLADRGLTINGFAKRSGLKQRTLHAWVKEGTRVPDEGLATIARETGLPAGYWIDSAAPYPPAIDYEGLVAQVIAAVRAMPPAKARAVAELLNDARETDRLLAARRALRGG